MNKKIVFAFILIFLINLLLVSGDVNIEGRIKTFTSFFVSDNPEGVFFNHESGDFLIKRLNIRLGFNGNINDNISYSVKFDGFTYSGEILNDYNFGESDFLSNPVSTEYFSLNLYESYIKVSGFLFENLDLTIGKQRISWGTADKANVVDNLNPLDFANFFTFDPDYSFERRPQNALNFEYYFSNDWKLQFVLLLQHQVSPLPFGYSYMTKNSIGLNNVTLNKTWENNLNDLNYGLRFDFNLLNTDFGITYYKGNMSIPIITNMDLINSKAEFSFPKISVFGLDFSTELFGFGIWGEIAYITPDTIDSFLIMPVVQNNQIFVSENHFELLNDGFIKYVLGFDYNFGHGFYVNLQYLHGFFDEYSYTDEAKQFLGYKKGMFNGEIEDYIIGVLDYKFNDDSSKLELSFIYEISDNTSLSLTPLAEIKIKDGLYIQAGGFFVINGEPDTTKFGLFKDDKLIYIGAKINF